MARGAWGVARPTHLVAGVTPVIAGVKLGQLTHGHSQIGSKTRNERHGEEEEIKGSAATCVGARGEQRRRRIWRRRLRPDLGKMGAAAVLQGEGARFLGGEEGGEVGEAVGELVWARGAPEGRGRRWLACSLGFAHMNVHREERTEKMQGEEESS